MRGNETKHMGFELRPAAPEDFAFAFEAKRDALGPHIAARWGWDDALQRALPGFRVVGESDIHRFLVVPPRREREAHS